MLKYVFNIMFVKHGKFQFERFMSVLIIVILGAALLFTANFGFQWKGFSCGNKPIDAKVNVGRP
jgi:hypothetical protein